MIDRGERNGLARLRAGGNEVELVYRDISKIDGIHEELARRAPSKRGVLAFVCRFGFLRGDSSEAIQDIVGEIRAVRSLLKANQAGEHDYLQAWMDANSKTIRSPAGWVTPTPQSPSTRTPHLFANTDEKAANAIDAALGELR